MSKLRFEINYKSLELELQEALKADELYKLQNDAKLRAVEQKVPTYEDFRQMVLAAHLKPLQCADIQSNMKKSWNSVSNSDNLNTRITFEELKQSNDCLKSLNNVDHTLEKKVPNTYEEFMEIWKTIKTYKTKLSYLQNIKHILPDRICKREIPSTLLVEIINVCLQNASVINNIATIIDILTTLSKCNRFSLAISFMGKDERKICTKLFHEMLIKVKDNDKNIEDMIKTLGLIYEITFE